MSTDLETSAADSGVLAEFGPLFKPESIAVVGASTRGGGVGVTFLRNLKGAGYAGRVYVLHPTATEIEGCPAVASFADIPETVDYGYYAIPAAAVPASLEDAAGKLRFAQVVTSGFSEESEAGAEIEARALAVARSGGIRILGPNCLGTYSPGAGVAFIEDSPSESGSCAVISQSGGLSVDFIRGGGRLGVRFSGVVSVGNAIDVHPADLLEYFLADPETEVIGMYLESSRGGQRLVETLKANAGRKPIVLLKGGLTGSGSLAAASHTGAMATDGRVWEGIAAQTGCCLVETVAEFLEALLAAQTQSHRSPPEGGVILFGNGGGASVLAADSFDRSGLMLTQFGDDTLNSLNDLKLPPGTSIRNPIDLPAGTMKLENGAASGSILERALLDANQTWAVVAHLNVTVMVPATGDLSANREAFDGLLGTIAGVADAHVDVAFAVVLRSEGQGPSVEACRESRAMLLKRGIMVFEELEDAARGLANLKRILEARGRAESRVASGHQGASERDLAEASAILQGARDAGQDALNESESKRLLAAFGVNVPRGTSVEAGYSVGQIAEAIGDLKAPYAVKVLSSVVLHKSDVGGVQLGCQGPDEVAEAVRSISANLEAAGHRETRFLVEEQSVSGHELVIGGYQDNELGPVAMVGIGGVLVEVLGDVSYGVCPIANDEAEGMFNRLRLAPLLHGVRGKPPVPMDKVLGIFEAVAGPNGVLTQFAGQIAEIDLNPVIASVSDAVAVDARIVLSKL